jgi:hypothetical protein
LLERDLFTSSVSLEHCLSTPSPHTFITESEMSPGRDWFISYTYLCVLDFFFFFGSTGVGTQGLTLARQTLYHLSLLLALFCVGYF